MNYLGWLFFRDAAWHLPLGANPAYGLPLGSSVVYSDSIPLLALAFKPFSSLLSPTFHYFAFWILTCLMLQAAITFKLMQRITHDFILCCLGALFFALSPVMLSRLDGHFPLLAHWLLLWGLLLCFAKDFKAAQWVVLLCLAVTIPVTNEIRTLS